ncbi:MAG: serpin family protein [Desulfobacteraceae bacterium]|nr:serpin family protein [Desulfobacteraceae bacterium]
MDKNHKRLCIQKIIFEYESSFDEIEDLLTELRELREFCYENSSNLVTRNLSPDVSDADLNELVNGNSEFAFDFYHELVGNTDGNLFFSPHSISTALAMTYAGARNNTEKQMADVLHFTLEQESLHPAFNALDLELASRGENAEATDGKGFRLNIANSLWGQEGYPFLNSFLDMTAANYGSGMTFLDFARHPEPSRTCINKWVYYNTETRIEDLIPKGEISSSTVLVLVNAIYFNAAWRSPFSEKSTHDGTFYLPDSSEVTTPLMWQEMKFGYTEGENYQATELPYDGEELSMTVLLPKEGQFEAFEKTLTSERLDAIIENMETQDVYLTLPKFSFESDSLSLKDTFTQMGMEDPFIGSADFSGIDGSPGLRISNIFHKAFVAVDEAGTEAAAATGVGVDTSLPDVIYDFKVNRPFIFFIRDIDTGAILFIGRIVNPVG